MPTAAARRSNLAGCQFCRHPPRGHSGSFQLGQDRRELSRPFDRLGAIGWRQPVGTIAAQLDAARPCRLMESGADFVAADNPHANKLMVHLLAAFAEHEREQISQRTKDALAAAKTRGMRLGRNGADRLAPVYRAEAVERARQLAPLLAELKDAGMSARRMAAELTARGIATPSGGRWHAQSVLRMIDRAGSAHPHTRDNGTCRPAERAA
jgi:Resolvase, N terminal domain